MRNYVGLMLVVLVLFLCSNKITAQTIDEKIESLLAKMTLKEKVGQMTQYTWSDTLRQGALRTLLRQGKLGSILNATGADNINAIQKIAVEESRLGIPIIIGRDVIHGYRTIFPISLGESATWDPVMVEQAAQIAAREASSSGIHWTFAPMVDIARDARWGRIAEGAGEDTYMGKVMAAARVRGFQGKSLSDPETIVACAKHFAAYGAAEAGKDYNTVDISERTLREVYLPPFQAAADAGVGTFMTSFNEISGIPSSGNKFLMTKVLREEWDFNGFVVSDWNAITEMLNHGNVADTLEAAILSANVGVDMDMMGYAFQNKLPDAVKEGKISEATIDKTVRRILRVKFELGLFDRPYADPEREKNELLKKENRQFAREFAARAIVLLENDDDLLPLKKGIKSVALIGPLADSQMDPLGWWHCNGRAEEVVTVLQGFKNKLGTNVKITYSKGCEISGDDMSGFAEAIAVANDADVIVCVVGESYEMSGEGGSRADLGLPGKQLELVKSVHALGKPVVVVLMNGRPLALPWISENVPAVLEAWQPGTECGNAISDVIFGDVNPGGKLPVTFPVTVGQEPMYYNYKNSGRPPLVEDRHTNRYFEMMVKPQYPFGYGLSYTTFEFTDLQLSADTIGVASELTISATVKNTGKVTGDEVAQLYIRDLVGSVTRPVKELKGFKRITLNPGESRTVSFTLTPEHLSFYNQYMEFVVEPGKFMVWVGPNSQEGLEGSFEVVR